MRKVRFSVSLIVVRTLASVMFAPSAFAAQPELTSGFVCPVLGGQAGGDHGNSNPEPIVTIGGGSQSVIGPGRDRADTCHER